MTIQEIIRRNKAASGHFFDEKTMKCWRGVVAQTTGKIFGVYLYNADSRTYCCELTPSYEMHFLQSAFSFSHIEDATLHEALCDEIDEADVFCERVKYFHCYEIDALQKSKRGSLTAAGTYFYGNFKKSTDIENIIEAWHENPDY